MLSVTIKSIMLSVVMLNAVMLRLFAPDRQIRLGLYMKYHKERC